MPALIFDCDGVLADTERDGHLPAFNQAFSELGVPIRWSEAEYADQLRIGGGKERVLAALTPELVRRAGLPADPDERWKWVERVHGRKTAIFTEIVSSGALPARPGVVRIVDEAIAAGWTLAVASTSAEESVRSVLEHTLGAARARRLAVFAGDAVTTKKPDPAIYNLAVEQLGLARSETLAIEDSRNGLLAATGAGLCCVVTVSSFTRDEDFAEAALVVSSFGDDASLGDYVSLRDLERALADARRSVGRRVEDHLQTGPRSRQ